jgi:hypothetical protein
MTLMQGRDWQPQAENPDDRRPSKDPWKIAFDCLSRSRDPEDLAEFKRHVMLFRELAREEAARQALG